MDKLSDVPVNETAHTPQETNVMKKYFADADTSSSDSGTNAKTSWSSTLKLALYVTILFLLLSNPITDAVFCKVPYCGEGVFTLLGVKAVAFLVLFVAMYKFLI